MVVTAITYVEREVTLTPRIGPEMRQSSDPGKEMLAKK